MIFNSQEFFFFLIIVFALFWSIDNKYKPILLLIASYIFYGFNEPILTLLLLAVSIVSFLIAIKIEKAESKITRKLFLVMGLILLITPLLYFKYFNFFTQNFNWVLNLNIPIYKIILPIGISFFTFQVVGYLIDVYRKDLKAERSFITFALFKSFFPQLVAGPIERANHLLPQLKKHFEYKSQNFKDGLKITGWGLFKKIVIADRLAEFVDKVYQNYESQPGLILLIATVFFAIQIYCDFSGYSDMAIGIAKLFDIQLMQNFNRPYVSLSIIEFWKRWHISLSTWFKDYLYFPLGGNRVGLPRWCLNILIVFVVSGLWHGASWSFVIWGFLHGLAMIVIRFSTPIFNSLDSKFLSDFKLTKITKWSLTFSFVCLTWIFFRSENANQAFSIIEKIFLEIFDLSGYEFLANNLGSIGFTLEHTLLLALSLIIFMILDNLQDEKMIPHLLNLKDVFVRRSFQYLLILSIIFWGNFGESPFIYFRF